jgi:lysophospholipase L1-like esterase
MQDPVIVLFGDSYTAGRVAGTNRDGAFAAALGVCVRRDYALSGSTAIDWSIDVGGRLTGVCQADASVAVGSLIGNDAIAAMADGQVTAGEALNALVALAMVLYRIAREMPVLLMLYPDPYQGANRQAAEGVRRMNAAVTTVVQAVNGMASSNGPVMALDLGRVLGPGHFDGADIHPNEAGYAAMAAAVKDTLARM